MIVKLGPGQILKVNEFKKGGEATGLSAKLFGKISHPRIKLC